METQQLQTEYTDIKSVTHRVEHSILSTTHAVDREKLLEELAKDHELFVTIEENVITGGFGEQVMDYVSRAALDVQVRNIGISDEYVEHGNVEVLRKEVGLDRDTIAKQAVSDYLRIMENRKKEK